MIAPVIRKGGLYIVSPFGQRYRNGVYEKHEGVDIRTVETRPDAWIKKYENLPIVCPEPCQVIRVKRDDNDNGIIVLQGESGIEHKFIHLMIEKFKLKIGQAVPEGYRLPNSEIRGGSNSLHLHYEVRRNGKLFDPTIMFGEYYIDIEAIA